MDPNAMTAAPAASAAPGAAPSRPSGRLRNGELRRQVAAFLAEHPADAFTAGQVARALSGRSSGAVANALAALGARGEAEQTTAKPLRYRATATTAGATATTAGVAAAAASSSRPTASSAGATATRGMATRGGRSRRTPSPPAEPSASTQPAGALSVAGSGVEEAVSGPVPRPNGQMYHPRLLSGVPDVTALRKLRAAGVPALLYGPPGTGKTSVVEAAFGDLITVPGDGDTTVADLVGEYTQTADGRYVFVHGPLVRAMREGRCLFVDDATLIPPSVLAVVYPAMDGRRQIVVKANGGEVVDAVDGFYVVAGHNPGVHGAVLTDALSSRFSAQIRVSTDYDLATQLTIDRRAVRAARNLATRQAKGEIGWAPQLRELIAFARIADVLGVEAAAGNLVGIAPEEDRDTVAAVVRDAFGAAVAPLALGTRI
ncbi:AAA family ATPase [Pseudonocardia sp.]|uniref:AAA family ATPase n=1 Tax=Pseudonocardia sp. TaxID=60912 RepID=UPI003D0C7509